MKKLWATEYFEKKAGMAPQFSPQFATASPFTAYAGVEEAAKEHGVNPKKIQGDRVRNIPLNLASIALPTAAAIGGGLLGEHFGPAIGLSPVVGAGGGAALGSALSVPMVHQLGRMVGKARANELES